jgi:hypothetical protein
VKGTAACGPAFAAAPTCPLTLRSPSRARSRHVLPDQALHLVLQLRALEKLSLVRHWTP